MGAVVQTAMVSAIGSARYTPVTASGQRCGSRKVSGMSRTIFRQMVRKIGLSISARPTADDLCDGLAELVQAGKTTILFPDANELLALRKRQTVQRKEIYVCCGIYIDFQPGRMLRIPWNRPNRLVCFDPDALVNCIVQSALPALKLRKPDFFLRSSLLAKPHDFLHITLTANTVDFSKHLLCSRIYGNKVRHSCKNVHQNIPIGFKGLQIFGQNP